MPVIVAALQLGLDAFCCWHIWKTGRPYWWMFVVIGFPVFGAVGYLLFEVLPSAGAHHHVKRVIKHFDPGADFRARLAEVERCGSIANKLALADECINIAQFDDAIRIYRGVLQSHADDLPALTVLGEIDKRLRLGSHTYRRMNDSCRRDARKAYDAAFAAA